MDVEYKILNPKMTGRTPEYATEGSAAMDLRACIDEPLELGPGETRLVPTGIAIHIKDPAVAGLVLPRSGLGHRKGLVLGNLLGLIDSDYQGELMISLWNRSDRPALVEPMERVAQILFIPVHRARLVAVEAFADSARGEGGFGSTGRE